MLSISRIQDCPGLRTWQNTEKYLQELLIQKTMYLSALGRPYTIFKKTSPDPVDFDKFRHILCIVCFIKENIMLYYELNNILILV